MKKLNILRIAAIFGLLVTKSSLSMQNDMRNYSDFQDEESVREQITYKMGEVDTLMVPEKDSEEVTQKKVESIVNIIKETPEIKLEMLGNMGFNFELVELASAQLLAEDPKNINNNAINKEIVAAREIAQDHEKFMEKVSKKEEADEKHERDAVDSREFAISMQEDAMDMDEDDEETQVQINPEDVSTIKLIVQAIKNPNDRRLSLREWTKIRQKLAPVKVEAVNLSTLIEKFGKTTVAKALIDFTEENGDNSLPEIIDNDPKYIDLLEKF